MIKKIKDLLSNFSKEEEKIEEEGISKLDKACSALLIEVAFADKVFDESEISSLTTSLKEKFSDLQIVINGEVSTIEECLAHLDKVDGVMMGREAYDNPYLLKDVDNILFAKNKKAKKIRNAETPEAKAS